MAPLVTQVFPYLLRAHHKKQKKELLNLLSFYFMDPVVGSGIYGWIFPRLQQLPAGGSCPFEWSPAGPAASSSKSLKAGERRSREAPSLAGAAPEWSFPSSSLLHTIPGNVRRGWGSSRAPLSAPKPTGRAGLGFWEILGEM